MGESVQLLLQPRFPAADKAGGPHRSLSRLRVPDIVLSSETTAGRRFVVLDAKYRTSREAVLDGMASAHIYHDSLRWIDQQAERALLLVPRGGGAPWLEDAEFHGAHGVGVVEFGGDLGPSALRASMCGALTKRERRERP